MVSFTLELQEELQCPVFADRSSLLLLAQHMHYEFQKQAICHTKTYGL